MSWSLVLKASEFDKTFNTGEDVSDAIDRSLGAALERRARKCVNVDFPA